MGRQWGALQPLPHTPRTPPPNPSFLSATAAAATLKIDFLPQGFFFFFSLFYTFCRFMKTVHSNFLPLQKNGVKSSCQKAFS